MVRLRASRGVVKGDAERVAVPGALMADTVQEINAIAASRIVYRAAIHREDDSIALAKQRHFRARLHSRTLLGQHELSAAEISARLREQHGELQREDPLAVEVLMQAVVILWSVFQWERGGSLLSCAVALLEEHPQRG